MLPVAGCHCMFPGTQSKPSSMPHWCIRRCQRPGTGWCRCRAMNTVLRGAVPCKKEVCG